MIALVASTRHVLLAVGDAALWAVWSAGCGYVAHRLPASTLARDGPLRLRGVERDGRVYERVLRIKAWKDALPEAGSLFRGGFSKRRLRRHDRDYLEQFRIETRRAEWTHWAILSLSPVFSPGTRGAGARHARLRPGGERPLHPRAALQPGSARPEAAAPTPGIAAGSAAP